MSFCEKIEEAKAAIKNDPKIILEKIRIISFILIIVVTAISGIYFILQADLELTSKMWQVTAEINKIGTNDADGNPVIVSQAILIGKSKALALMVAVLLSFGAAIVSAFSETKKSNLILVYSLKAIALLLMVGFVIFVSNFDIEFLTSKGIKTFADFKSMTIILAYLSLTTIVINIASNAILGIKE